MDGWIAGSLDGWMDGWMDGSLDRWIAGWMDGWMDGWMSVCIGTYILQHSSMFKASAFALLACTPPDLHVFRLSVPRPRASLMDGF